MKCVLNPHTFKNHCAKCHFPAYPKVSLCNTRKQYFLGSVRLRPLLSDADSVMVILKASEGVPLKED